MTAADAIQDLSDLETARRIFREVLEAVADMPEPRRMERGGRLLHDKLQQESQRYFDRLSAACSRVAQEVDEAALAAGPGVEDLPVNGGAGASDCGAASQGGLT